jgi:hypothetical protein
MLMALPACTDSAGATLPATILQPASSLKIMPWVECNLPKHLDNTIAGLRTWGTMFDTAIVSTTPGNAGLLERVKAAVPGVRIIPGMKTFTILEDFDSAEDWRQVRDEIVAAMNAVGEKAVIFENEWAIRGIWGDRDFEPQDLDLEQLEAAMRAADFPPGVTYYWYPSVPSRDKRIQDLAESIVSVAQKVLGNVVLVDNASVNGPGAERSGSNIRAGEAIASLADGKIAAILYCYGPGSSWWQDEQLPDAIKLAHETHRLNTLILYPGQDRWAEAALTITGILERSDLGLSRRGDP